MKIPRRIDDGNRLKDWLRRPRADVRSVRIDPTSRSNQRIRITVGGDGTDRRSAPKSPGEVIAVHDPRSGRKVRCVVTMITGFAGSPDYEWAQDERIYIKDRWIDTGQP